MEVVSRKVKEEVGVLSWEVGRDLGILEETWEG